MYEDPFWAAENMQILASRLAVLSHHFQKICEQIIAF